MNECRAELFSFCENDGAKSLFVSIKKYKGYIEEEKR